MSLYVSRPFFKTGLVCAAACVLFTAAASAQVQTFTVTQPLLNLSSTQSFTVPNFNTGLGTLTDVSLTMTIRGKSVTIFDTSMFSQDWVNLVFNSPGSTQINADTIGAWSGLSDFPLVSYHKPAGKTVASMGVAGLLLYATPKNNNLGEYVDVNYTYTIGNTNTTPEPAAKYLSAIAGGAMLLLLIGRGLRRQAGEVSAPQVS
jgi:hypothetical protein